MTTVTVQASKTYDVIIGDGILADAKAAIQAVMPKAETFAIVTDDRVDALHGAALDVALEGLNTVKFVFPNGEASKNLQTYGALMEFLAEHHLTRTDGIIAFGGGVTGDMAGFAAATYLRGIRFVQIPTTLLAAVDSSVGGKTAVDLTAGKNLCGAFWQPELVLCDYRLLDTLPEDIFADGMAEVIKYGVIRDAALFERLHSPVRSDPEDVIAACVSNKRDIVNEDERENGIRALLNFGHTGAHGIEQCSGYEISHGSAVAMGMIIASRAARKRGLCGKEVEEGILRLLELHGLPSVCDFTPEQLAEVALADKKRAGGKITLIVPEKIGKCILHKVPVEELAGFFADGIAE